MSTLVKTDRITRHSPPNEMDQLPFNSECLVSYPDGKEEIYIQKSENDQKPFWILKTDLPT